MKRLNYIDGLKGRCALSVCLLHFLLIFSIDGYLGWKCLPEAVLQLVDYYLQWLPDPLTLPTNQLCSGTLL